MSKAGTLSSELICIHEINTENAQLKPSATLQANSSGRYINKFIYQLTALVKYI
jgi:hypothetical protein